MNSIEWLIEEMISKGFFKESVTLTNIDHLQYKAEEMHKQEILQTSKDSYISGYIDNQCKIDDSMNFPDEYYEETFVSKGSSDHIVDTNEMVEISDEEIDNAVVKEYENVGDEKLFPNHTDKDIWMNGFYDGARWYREQLKQRQ